MPKRFFEVLELYSCELCIGRVAWALKFDESEVKIVFEVIDNIYKWYQGFTTTIPGWDNKKLKDKYKSSFLR